jgi:hypothetical protein
MSLVSGICSGSAREGRQMSTLEYETIAASVVLTIPFAHTCLRALVRGLLSPSPCALVCRRGLRDVETSNDCRGPQ